LRAGWDVRLTGVRLLRAAAIPRLIPTWSAAAGVQLYTGIGNDFTKRFPLAVAAVTALPVRSCLIDSEAKQPIIALLICASVFPSGPRVIWRLHGSIR
jgi:hypothetical protein